MFDRKSFLIGVLTLTGAFLTLGHVQLAQTAKADVEVQSDDYQLVTGATQSGNDGVYVLSKRDNMIAFFVWDAGKRSIVPRDVRSIDGIMNGR